MGSIPLPALSVRAPEQADLMSQVGKLAQLKSLMQGQQLQRQQLQNAQLSNQSGQVELAQHQQQLRDQQAMTAAMQDWDGKDFNALPPLVLKRGASAQAVMSLKSGLLEQQQKLATLGADQLKLQTSKNDQLLGLLNTVKDGPGLMSAATEAINRGLIDPQHAQAAQQLSQLPPDQLQAQLDIFKKGLMGQAAQLEQAKSQAEIGKNTAQGVDAAAQARKATMEADNLQKFGGMSPAMAESRYLFIQSRRNQGQPLTPDDAAFAKAYEHNKTLVPTATINLQSGLLSQQAKDMAAQNYAQTGQLPSGMRSPAMSAQVLNAAASQQPGANIAANRATYKADSASLEALTKNRDAVTAFENTAGKNLDLFLNAAKKVVDSGSPWVNLPLRTVSMKGMGSADLAAFNAARQVAINEIAKVTGNPGLSGQLSDSARHEVESFIPQDANLKQIFQVANVLKQDMANRHQSYNEQIQSIRGRMGGGQQAAPKADPLGIR